MGKIHKTHASEYFFLYFVCVDAYLSRAEIYKKQGDHSLAVINYTLAMKCRPTDDEIYYKRGEMFEEEGDSARAIDDYSKVSIFVKLLCLFSVVDDIASGYGKYMKRGRLVKKDKQFSLDEMRHLGRMIRDNWMCEIR